MPESTTPTIGYLSRLFGTGIEYCLSFTSDVFIGGATPIIGTNEILFTSALFEIIFNA